MNAVVDTVGLIVNNGEDCDSTQVYVLCIEHLTQPVTISALLSECAEFGFLSSSPH